MSGYPNGNPHYSLSYPSPYPQQNQIYPQIAPQSFGVPGAQYPGVPPQPYAVPGHPSAPAYPGFQPPGQMMPPGGIPAVSPTPVYPGYPTQHPIPPVEWIPCTDHSAEAQSYRAVVAGYEGHDGSPLWIIRAHHEGDVIPGKLAIKHKSAYVPWGGRENRVHNFEVCVAQPERIRWVQNHDGNIPPNAVPGGHTSSGEPLYIGRAKEQGSLTPGKVHPSHKALYISFAGNEVPHKVYEILCTA